MNEKKRWNKEFSLFCFSNCGITKHTSNRRSEIVTSCTCRCKSMYENL